MYRVDQKSGATILSIAYISNTAQFWEYQRRSIPNTAFCIGFNTK